ncbi:plastocyanin/azurin family copper-binding protein [Halococcus sp. AFM35]|uniref:plastocyanin/azurin family copper-binding protein n=1 Tax=Halococcus sp. AFM35 TaxID=3421653 RepID=UPI003EB8145B
MQRTSRRRFLAGIGTASAALAAGCSTGGSSGGSGDSAGGTTESTGGGTTNDGSASANTTNRGDRTTGGSETTSGSSGGGSATGGETTVAAGPNGRLVFEPTAVEVGVGDTVVWEFKSAGHNVSAVPKDSEKVSIPNGAKPFASYESGDLYAVVPEGETYEHTFETPGEYTYVCIPHVASGMVGTVTVTE